MNISVNQNGWAIAKLEDIALRITKGGTPTTYGFSFQQNGINFLKVQNINSGRVDLKSITDFISEEAHEYQLKSKLMVGDVLFSIAGTIGETCVVRQEYLPANTNQALAIIRGTDCAIVPALLKHQLEAFVAKVKIKARGGAMNNVSLDDLKKLQIYIPPLPEQHRIVAKIEELFSSLDKGIENLKTAQAQLKTYRQAVLKWAFEGKLTNENVKNGELLEGWSEKIISEIADTFGGYAFKSGEFRQNGKYQVLRMGNIRPGVLRYEESPVFLENVDRSVLARALLKINDLIVTQTGTKGKRDYGFTVLIPKTNLLLNQRIAAIRCNEKCLPKFLLYFTWTDKFKSQFFAHETGNVGQGNVGIRAVTDTIVTIPTISEQHRIVSEIETRLSVCDKLEESITQSLLQAEALRQSILKKAFEGKLVPQNPNDEPASILLERIRAERASVGEKKAATANKKGRGKRNGK